MGDVSRIEGLLGPDPTLEERVVGGGPIWEGRIFSVEHLEVELPDGSRGWRELALNSGGAGVVAIRDGCVCLVRQYRIALRRVTLEIPAGKLAPGEAGATCAARELREETGLRAERLVPLVTTVGAPGFTSEHTEVFLAEGLSAGEAEPDPGELVNVAWVPLADVVDAIGRGVIQDAKTVAGVLAALTRDGGLRC